MVSIKRVFFRTGHTPTKKHDFVSDKGQVNGVANSGTQNGINRRSTSPKVSESVLGETTDDNLSQLEEIEEPDLLQREIAEQKRRAAYEKVWVSYAFMPQTSPQVHVGSLKT
jgi:hypothetical protein